MKIVSCLTSLTRNSGGLFTSVKELTNHVNSFHDVENVILGPYDNEFPDDIASWKPARTIDVPVLNNFLHFNYSPNFLSVINSERPDIVHAHGLWQYQSIVVNRLKRRTGTPYVVSPHGMLDNWAVNHHKARKLIALYLYESSFLNSANTIRALCASEAESIRQLGIKSPIAIIPNGISPLSVNFVPKIVKTNKSPVKKLLYLGRIHEKKGIYNLVNAWSALNNQDWFLTIAGWGDKHSENRLSSLIKKVQNNRNIEYVGPVHGAAKDDLLSDCDAFILPSYSEGMPMAVLEAMAHSKFTVLTPQCNIPEAVAAGAALEIEPGISGLMTGLPKLFAMDDFARMQSGIKGSKLIESLFLWPTIAQNLFTTYEWILGRRSKPDFVYTG